MISFLATLLAIHSALTHASAVPRYAAVPASSVASDAAILLPHFSGMFVAITSTTGEWTQDQWETDCRSMAQAGMKFLVVPHTGRQVAPPSKECPQGKFEMYYPLSAPLDDPTCYSQIGAVNAEGGTLGNIFRAAKLAGLTGGVHLGLMFAPAEHGFPSQKRNGTFANWGIFQGGVASALHSLFAGHPGNDYAKISGFYTEIEFSNDLVWEENMKKFGRDYLGTIGQRVARLTAAAHGDYQVWASPYSIGNLTRHPTGFSSPAEYATAMATAFTSANENAPASKPYFHHVAMQDSMGAQGNSFQNASDFLGNMTERVTTWANVELFEVWPRSCQWPQPCHGRHPAPWSRIKAQMANEAAQLGGGEQAILIAWEWYSCFSPNAHGDPHHPFPNETLANYRSYMSYLGRTVPEETVRGGMKRRTTTPEEFGARGDGKVDDSIPIKRALDSCIGYSRCDVRFANTYLSGPVIIQSSGVTLNVTGSLLMLRREDYPQGDPRAGFISNEGGVSDIHITGPGLIGNEHLPLEWWACKLTGCWRPHLIVLNGVNGLHIDGQLHLKNSPNHNIEVVSCTAVRVKDIFIEAPHSSPNTDGINFYGGHDQSFINSVVSNGDDCVSVVPIGENTASCINGDPAQAACRGGNVVVNNVSCVGGHGIAIGGIRHGTVSNVTFSNMTATSGPGDTQGLYSPGGIRIKSYPNSTGSVYNVVYRDIVLDGVYTPISVLTHYCPWPCTTKDGSHACYFHDILFDNVRGTGRNVQQGIFNCSSKVPCTNLTLRNVMLDTESPRAKLTCNKNAGLVFEESSPNFCTGQTELK
eukprot:g5194.t1